MLCMWVGLGPGRVAGAACRLSVLAVHPELGDELGAAAGGVSARLRAPVGGSGARPGRRHRPGPGPAHRHCLRLGGQLKS